MFYENNDTRHKGIEEKINKNRIITRIETAVQKMAQEPNPSSPFLERREHVSADKE